MAPMNIRRVAGWPVREISSAPSVCALVAATVALNLGVAAPVPLLRAVVTLPLALLVPGYAVVLALFGRRLPLDAAPLAALTALLSMAFYPLLALVLYAAGWPLATGSVLAGTDAAILLFTAVAAARMATLHPPLRQAALRPPLVNTEMEDEESGSASRRPRGPARLALGGLGVAAMLILLGAVTVGTTRVLPASPAAPSTAFYLAGRWSRLSSVVSLAPGHRLAVVVGIANNTGRRQVYRLSPLLDGARWRAVMVTLPAGATWTGTVAGPVPAGGCLRRLSLTLHSGDSRVALRPLVLWVQAGTVLPRWCARTGAWSS